LKIAGIAVDSRLQLVLLFISTPSWKRRGESGKGREGGRERENDPNYFAFVAY